MAKPVDELEVFPGFVLGFRFFDLPNRGMLQDLLARSRGRHSLFRKPLI